MRPASQYTHLFFDMDGTVTRSRSAITPEMKDALLKLLAGGRDVILVSGAALSQAVTQTEKLPIVYLSQNGNHAHDGKTQSDMWKEMLSDAEKTEIHTHIKSMPREWEVKDENDLIEDRGSQISYSLLGHHEDISKKEAFDPGGKRRQAMLASHPLFSETVEVVIGGTTTFDYIQHGRHKGYNVIRLIKEKGWNKDDCVYVGDALYDGGNDETVLGIVDTKQVKDPDETLAFIRENLAA